jgi:hypothetical protein
VKRAVVVSIVALVVVFGVGVFSATRQDVRQENVVADTICPTDSTNTLAAQSVPTATFVPCVSLLGGRWSVTSETFDDDGTTITMTGTDAVDLRWDVAFADVCDTDDLTRDGQSGDVTSYLREDTSGSAHEREHVQVFAGGCVTSTLDIPTKYDRAQVLEDVDATLVLIPRSDIDREVREQTDGNLGLDP